VAALILTVNVSAQDFIWKAGNLSFFDNREYFNKYVQPQTMLGTQTFGEVGFKIDGQNSFSVGANYLYESGSQATINNLKPICYFKHDGKYIQVIVGSFSREGLYRLPDVLEHDTIRYYRPNNEGIFLSGGKGDFNQNLWLDWTSRQTATDRETFLIGATGKFTPGKWLFRYDFLMYHFAGKAVKEPNDHIRDNGGFCVFTGYNFTPYTNLDTLYLNAGVTGSYDRLRHVYDIDTRFGNLCEFGASYKGVGLKSVLYWGEGQTQLVGDGMYKARFYERTDLIWQFARRGRVKAQAAFTLHFLPEVLDFSQSLVIYIDLTGSKKLKLPLD
jgi:hypothetical protein